MERAILTKFAQELSADGQVTNVQVTYSNYENGQSFNAIINLSEPDGITDMTRLNVVQADSYARKKLRDILAKPGIVQTDGEDVVETTE